MPAPNLGSAEWLIVTQNVSIAIDPFGLVPQANQKVMWNQAKEIDSMFKHGVHKGKNNGMADDMFYCPDCDSFRRCSGGSHQIYIRCFGTGDGHCVTCSE